MLPLRRKLRLLPLPQQPAASTTFRDTCCAKQCTRNHSINSSSWRRRKHCSMMLGVFVAVVLILLLDVSRLELLPRSSAWQTTTVPLPVFHRGTNNAPSRQRVLLLHLFQWKQRWQPPNNHRCFATTTTIQLFSSGNVPPYQDEVNALIYQAAAESCGLTPDQLVIEYKADSRIVVQVQSNSGNMIAYVRSDDEDEEMDVVVGDEDFELSDDHDVDEMNFLYDSDDDDVDPEVATLNVSLPLDFGEEAALPTPVDDPSTTSMVGVDLAVLARAINAALEKNDVANTTSGTLGWEIAKMHEIEVTTPGASDELTTDRMFAAYRGFDVLVQHRDPKTKNIKVVEGRLVEKNSDSVVINIKGRLKNLKNMDVLSVKLPKAKRKKACAKQSLVSF